jgi:hypothetical protein
MDKQNSSLKSEEFYFLRIPLYLKGWSQCNLLQNIKYNSVCENSFFIVNYYQQIRTPYLSFCWQLMFWKIRVYNLKQGFR